jgi:putative transposase
MELRVQLMEDYEEGESIQALSEIYKVSRKTIYKWLERYQAEGVAGLADRSRAPHHHPHQLGEDMIQRIVQARQKWKWGPRKLLAKLQQIEPQQSWPAASTIAELLQRKGLTTPRRKRLRTPLYRQPLAEPTQANQTWCADFKGWFRTHDGTRCDPLTISDKHTRYLLRCQLTPKTDTTHVEAIFDAAFSEYGLPERIHTDNGAPFASKAPAGLSRLSLRWVKLGIVVERSRPATPQDNGRHERLHLTLKQAVPIEAHPRRQQQALSEFQYMYNFERPHEALDNQTPASLYVSSPRPLPRRVPELEYPSSVIVRRVSTSGELNWKGTPIFVSEVFRGELLGLEQNDDRFWRMRFGPVQVGWLDTHRRCFHRTLPRGAELTTQGPWK